MAKKNVTRKLTAILYADVAGYSRLTGEDEEGTHHTLSTYLDVLTDAIKNHGGEVVHFAGDAVLADFTSVVAALICAMEVQRDLAARNAALADENRLQFRIGLNLGEVIVDRGDIYGDGVNIAARLEGLAEPGGICISGRFYQQIENKLDVGYEYLGERDVKNIKKPVRVYHVLLEPEAAGTVLGEPRRAAQSWRLPALATVLVILFVAGGMAWWFQPWEPTVEPASLERMAFPLPDKPSIAVLPFANMSADPEQEFLADGVTENIIAAISTVPDIFVISRSSVFTYKGRTVKVQRVAEELGVRHVLEGSVQRSGDKVRITAQLIDAITGYHVWSGRYDRDVKDIFDLQDEITLKIVTALQVELTEGELARVRQRGTDNLEAWLLVTQSLEHFMQFTKGGNVRARELAQKAIAVDPKYPDAYIRLARTHLIDFQAGWVADRAESLKRTVELVQQALKLDDAYPATYNILGSIHLFLRQHDRAIAYTEKAISLNPNHSLAKAHLAMILNYAGQPEKAIALLQNAMRLSPYYPDWFLGELGRAYFLTGRYDEAIKALKQRLRRNPNSSEAYVLLAAAYGASSREEEAQAALAEFVKPRPYYTLKHYAQGEFYKNPGDLKRVLDGLRKAGLPE